MPLKELFTCGTTRPSSHLYVHCSSRISVVFLFPIFSDTVTEVAF